MDRKVKRPLTALEIPLEPRSSHEEFSLFKPPEGESKISTSPQLLLATHRFLSRGVCVGVCLGGVDNTALYICITVTHEYWVSWLTALSLTFDLPPAEVEHFSPVRVSEKVLFHLLRHPSVNQEVHFDLNNRLSASHYLYTRNHPVDYFILLLQVCVHSNSL